MRTRERLYAQLKTRRMNLGLSLPATANSVIANGFSRQGRPRKKLSRSRQCGYWE
jgi:hypothetical protein